MTSTNTNFTQQAVSKFQNLNADDRLAVLALLFTQISEEVPASALNCMPSDGTADLVAEIQNLSHSEQISALRNLQNQSEGGDTGISTDNYASMDAECKLAFWYHLAQNLGGSVVGIPHDYIPSEAAAEVLDLFQMDSTEEIMTFMQRVLSKA
ncbi:Orange carotenoid-binding protein [Scytonema hofmannii FACHB-248]|uniref:Orange carotenoid-binding protein n=1 Tax=Scytonema hofmannii FACHB-248 TaxID=1842502 RepID=A0ABR8GXJ9_9CYAN|nr:MULTISPECIES: orange carotenoid protein N-terminal domain-containing protein [Nostocales]MBD2607942.1 Orange carotenoid-binding protein [Scytonema hofmannii FACHB-248]